MGRRRTVIRTALALVAALLAAVATAGCAGSRAASASAGSFTPATPGVLTVVTSEVPSAGFWEGSPAHPTGGVEYDLARALAQRFGLHAVRVRVVPFRRLVAGDLGGADLGLALITPTPEREQVLGFSTPYLDAAPTVVVRRGISVPDLKIARQLRWGVVSSTTFHGIVESSITPLRPVTHFATRNELLAALGAGRIDAALFDLPDAVAVADGSHGRLQVAAQLPISESIAAALPQDSDNVEALDSAIRAFVADGTIQDLVRRWVGPQAADAEHQVPLLHTTR